MELTGIFVYPIKAMGGIALNSAKIEERGIRFDRRWMLIDDQNRFICQRQKADLALFKIEIQEDQLEVYWKGESITIPYIEKAYTQETIATVWDDEVKKVLIASEEINEWFSKHLEISCRLVFQGVNAKRLTSRKYAPSQEVSFADGYPFLIISEESLEFLNKKLPQPVEMNRFRANFIVKGLDPHGEDDYHDIQIGQVHFTGVKPCARCSVVTINQSNIEKSKEPLFTLSTYRKVGKKVLFGQCLLVQKSDNDTVQLGDEVTLSNKKIKDN